jgi:hypothetical protein
MHCFCASGATVAMCTALQCLHSLVYTALLCLALPCTACTALHSMHCLAQIALPWLSDGLGCVVSSPVAMHHSVLLSSCFRTLGIMYGLCPQYVVWPVLPADSPVILTSLQVSCSLIVSYPVILTSLQPYYQKRRTLRS